MARGDAPLDRPGRRCAPPPPGAPDRAPEQPRLLAGHLRPDPAEGTAHTPRAREGHRVRPGPRIYASRGTERARGPWRVPQDGPGRRLVRLPRADRADARAGPAR